VPVQIWHKQVPPERPRDLHLPPAQTAGRPTGRRRDDDDLILRYNHCGRWFRVVAEYTLNSPTRGLKTSDHLSNSFNNHELCEIPKGLNATLVRVYDNLWCMLTGLAEPWLGFRSGGYSPAWLTGSYVPTASGAFDQGRSTPQLSWLGLLRAWKRLASVTAISVVAATSNLGASDDHGNSSATATKVAVPSVTAGVLDDDDVDVFSFDVRDAGVFSLEIHGFLRAVGRIEDTHGNTTVESELPIEQPLMQGTYYVSIRSASTSGIIRAPYDFQIYSDSDHDADGIPDYMDAFPRDSARIYPINGISTTVDNRIVIELESEDIDPANPLDLIQRSVVFTPDREGHYSREIRTLEWEEEIGNPVQDGSVIQFHGFDFEYAGQVWNSFYISQHGLVTLGGPLTYDYWQAQNRHWPLRRIATNFIRNPTISPLFKPTQVAELYVKKLTDQVVITWKTWEPEFYTRVSIRQERPSQFQAVLHANGSIRFSYLDVTFKDGIVGLFTEFTKSGTVATINDAKDIELPKHLDLLEVTLSASNNDAIIVEFNTRGAIPDTSNESVY